MASDATPAVAAAATARWASPPGGWRDRNFSRHDSLTDEPANDKPPASPPRKSWKGALQRQRMSRQELEIIGSSSSRSPSPSTSTPGSSRTPSPSSSSGRKDLGELLSTARFAAPKPLSLSTFDDVRVGYVFHLPHEGEVPESSIFHKSKLQQEPCCDLFGHPVVVTKKSSDGIVEFQICTSFSARSSDGGIPLSKSLDSRRSILLCDYHDKRGKYSVREHDGTERLWMAPGSGKFEKPTYINLRGYTFHIELEHLKAWTTARGTPIIFSKESIDKIVRPSWNAWR